MSNLSTVAAAARAFLAEDFDSVTRAELTSLLAKAEGGDVAAQKDLEDRFTGTLAFGTAGLRGRVEAGTNRMNRVVVGPDKALYVGGVGSTGNGGQEGKLMHGLQRIAFKTGIDTTPVFVVPEGRYFFMGDDRDNSDDSRGSVGYVPIDHLVGKAQFVFISFDHIVPRADRLLKGLN
jgi:hypothetical protein